ncbi:MAG: glycosyltransferase family 2 protein [Brachybacterium sp.]|nr:glycosyltransferase family 2 protein [Brachybacterium sp.]
MTPTAPTTPLVTAVVPAYDSDRTLRATLESLTAQTYPHLEILVIDDGSRHLPARDIPEDPRIIVDHQTTNRGYSWVTNHAIGRARGEWITFVDADDTVTPTYVERHLQAGLRHDADLVLSPLMAVREGRHIGSLRFRAPGPVADARTAFRAIAAGDVVGSQHVMFRRPRQESPANLIHSDFVLILRHIARSRAVAFVDEPLYHYVIHAGSQTGRLRPGVWELTDLPTVLAPTVTDLFARDEATEVQAQLEHHMLTQVLHKAAREREDTVLRRRLRRWCRSRLTADGITAALRRRDWTTAASWALARTSPTLHGHAYRAYDALKDRRATPGAPDRALAEAR